MFQRTFSGQGIDLDGQVLPTSDVDLRAGLPKADASALSETRPDSSGQPTAAGLKALADIAGKHSMTPEAMKEIITAVLGAFSVNAGVAQRNPGTPHQPMPSLDDQTFSPRSSDTMPDATIRSVRMPLAWRMSRLDGDVTYADGRAQLRSWIEDINERRRLEGKPEGDFSRLLNRRYLPEEMKYNPETNSITLVGNLQPRWHYYWRRALAAYKVIAGK